MVVEIAVLNVLPGKESDFERAVEAARPLIAATPGFHSINLHRCIESPNRYLLLVHWNRLKDHTVGFRQGPNYQRWRALPHHFYDPFPIVEHYDGVSVCGERNDDSPSCTVIPRSNATKDLHLR